MIQVNAMGDTCPIPVVKTKNAIKELKGPGVVEVLVDNEIAVQNLTKMANQKGYGIKSEKLEQNKFQVTFNIGEVPAKTAENDTSDEVCLVTPADHHGRRNTVVVISSAKMGEGSGELGAILMKGFIYALCQQDTLPKTILFYNGGAALTCEESPSLEDLKSLEAQGVEILTCGTCLNFYGLTGKLKVGDISNMYSITEKLIQADMIVKP